MRDFHHSGVLDPPNGRGVQMVIIPYLLTIMVDLTSETCRTIVSYHADKNEASFRNGIDHHDDQMCDYHHSGVLHPPSGRGVQMVIMPYLLTIMVDLTSGTCRKIKVIMLTRMRQVLEVKSTMVLSRYAPF